MRSAAWLLLSTSTLFALGCPAPEPSPEDAGTDAGVFVCDVVPPTTCPTPAITFTDITPILQERCITCHNGAVNGPWPLRTYEEVSDWQDTVRSEVANCTMPPTDAGLFISNEDRVTLLSFIRCGLPP